MLVKESARAMAFRILRRVEGEGAYASILLQNLPASAPAAEVRLATELVYGVLRNRLHDEHVLTALAGRPLERIDPGVAILFRIAAHQILRLDRIPPRAAVHEAVEMARSLPGSPGRSRAVAGFLNAVLRRLARERDSLPVPPPPAPGAPLREAAEALAVRWSHPRWVVERWLERLGPEETGRLLEAGNRRPALCAWVDPARSASPEVIASLASEGIEAVPASSAGFLEVRRGALHRSTAFARGWIYIQDEASGLIARVVSPDPGSRVLDACAAPGGKSLALARMTGPEGRVVAAEIHPARAGLITANAARHDVKNIQPVVCDARVLPLSAPFDSVLVDAPCSGTGVFRRDPETRFRLGPDDLVKLAGTQREILEAAARLVRQGGRLVYSVCSLEPEEGEESVSSFLLDHPGFVREEILDRIDGRSELVGEDGGLRTWPHRHGMDGFYAASLRRER